MLEKKKNKMTPAQEAALAKARAAAAEKVKAAKALTEQPVAEQPSLEVIYRDISKRLDDMTILLKEIYNNMPTRLKTDWLK